MTSLDEAFHAAAVALEEDLRKIDAGEEHASPFKRALIAGAIRAWKLPSEHESGGFSVDEEAHSSTAEPTCHRDQGTTTDEPENLGLAVAEIMAFDGGSPTALFTTGLTIDGGKP